MTGHLVRLAARATRPASGGLRPRVPALFERPAGLFAGHLTVALRPTGEDVDAVGEPGERAAAPRVPGPGVPETRRPAGGPRPVPPTRRAAPAGSGTPATPAPTRGADGEDLRTAQPTRRARRAGRRLVATAGRAPDDASPSRSPAAEESPRSSSAESSARQTPVPEQVVASLVAEAVSAGLRPRAAGRAPHESDDDAGSVRGTVPRADPAATTPLPRLQTARSPEATRRDRRPAASEVTVNIGRIEVVPPAPEPRPPAARRPPPQARASGAPPLADYLRGRNRR